MPTPPTAATEALFSQFSMVPDSVMRPAMPPTPALPETDPETLTPDAVASFAIMPQRMPASSLWGTVTSASATVRFFTVAPSRMPKRPMAKSAPWVEAIFRPLMTWPAPSKVPAKGVLPSAIPLLLRVPTPMGVHSALSRSMSAPRATYLPS